MESIPRQSNQPNSIPKNEQFLDIPPPSYESRLGEAAMSGAGVAYEPSLPKRRHTPPVDSRGVRVSIPGHPEIVAFKLGGGSKKDQVVDDLIKLHDLISKNGNDSTD